jgi:hypothetical protein
MAWAAFAKGAILGAVITATLYRRRERKEGGGIAAGLSTGGASRVGCHPRQDQLTHPGAV